MELMPHLKLSDELNIKYAILPGDPAKGGPDRGAAGRGAATGI